MGAECATARRKPGLREEGRVYEKEVGSVRRTKSARRKKCMRRETSHVMRYDLGFFRLRWIDLEYDYFPLLLPGSLVA